MTADNRRTFLKKATVLAGTLGSGLLPALAAGETQAPRAVTRKTNNLWPDKSPNNHQHEKFGVPRLELFIPEGAATGKRAAIVVCPGGGYRNLAAHEGQPFAELFAAQGIVAAVLTYHIFPHQFPLPYSDACRAMRLMRQQARELHIDPARVGLMGFSAGGTWPPRWPPSPTSTAIPRMTWPAASPPGPTA